MFHRSIKVLGCIVKNPFLNIGIGLLFLYGGISEAIYEFKHLEEFRLGAHHGAIPFAILHTFKSLTCFFEGLEHLDQAGEDGQRSD